MGDLFKMTLKEKIKELPKKPGVYIMKDFMDNIIYIGKSKSLKNRVSQYFQSSKSHTPKIVRMIGNIRDFDYIVTDTELDALLLECKLIKLYKPMYNKQMKNEKAYPYIRLTINEEFPTLIITYGDDEDKGLHFGPYTSLSTAEKIISFIYEKYPIRRCNTPNMIKESLGCLNYHLGRCIGCCRSDTDKSLYKEYINEIVSLLNGNGVRCIEELEEKMKIASESLDFQKAAKYRDEVQVVKHIVSMEKVKSHAEERRNILTFEYIDEDKIKVFLIRGNNILYSKIHVIEKEEKSIENKFKMMHQNIKELVYSYFSIEDNRVIKLTKEDIDESNIIYSYLVKERDYIKTIVIPSLWLSTEDKSLDREIVKILKELI